MKGWQRLIGRLLGATALLVLWLNLQVQAYGAPGHVLDLRVLLARLLLCYVAVFWLRLAWQSLVARRPPAPGAALPARPSYQARVAG